MSAVSNSAAAFYGYFRDRESGTNARQVDGAGTAGQAATAPQTTAPPPGDDGASSDALAPTQAQDRLEALIAGQVATGKLSDEAGAALRKAFGPARRRARPDAGGGTDAFGRGHRLRWADRGAGYG